LYILINGAGPVGLPSAEHAHEELAASWAPARSPVNAGYALRLNYVLNADIFAVAVSAGSAGLVMDQVQFSRISGAASATAGTAMLSRKAILRQHDPGD
jgi:hypothetical protein